MARVGARAVDEMAVEVYSDADDLLTNNGLCSSKLFLNWKYSSSTFVQSKPINLPLHLPSPISKLVSSDLRRVSR